MSKKKHRQVGTTSVLTPSPAPTSDGHGNARWYWIALWCGALFLRLLYNWEIHATDLATTLLGDARAYDAWAGRIAAGDWRGEGVFYQAPLYPYFLGILYWLGGHHLGMVRIVQALIGATSCVFLGKAGQHFFSRSVGLAAGVLLALNPTAVFFDSLIQKAVLDLFFFTLVLLLTGYLTRYPQKTCAWLALGAALGFLTLTRENALVILPWLALLAWRQKESRARGWRSLFSMVFGVAIVLLPVALRNLAVGGEFHLTTSQLGPNFFIGNNEKADGTYQPLKPGRGDPIYERIDATELAEGNLGRKLSPDEVSDYWLGKGFDFIRSHPGQWLALMGQKWFLVWNAAELGDTEDQSAYLPYARLLRWLFSSLHFGVMCPLAVMGIVWTWKDRKQLWLLYAIALTYALSVAIFYVFSRYRLPLIPVAILFAAAGIKSVHCRLRDVPVRARWVGLGFALGTAVFVNWPTEAPTAANVTYYNLGKRLAEEGDYDRAIIYLRMVVQKVPNSDLAHADLGRALYRVGKVDEAVQHLQLAVSLNPGQADAWYNLGVGLGDQRRFDEAIKCYRKTIELDPRHALAYNNLADTLFEKGEASEAIDCLQRAAQIDPKFAAAHLNLGVALIRVGQIDEAIKSLESCIQVQPDLWQAHYNLGLVKADRGDPKGAVASLRRAEELMPAGSPLLGKLRTLLNEQISKAEKQR